MNEEQFHKKANALVKEKSPYLLQHAYNPVEWFPWGDEAFEKAQEEDKPVFLSIGYSTCHWCHVMENESFENPEVAQRLNEKFVCIKVDREERPDVDAVYMAVCQMLTGSGGWPLTIIMTPDRVPFYAGTYFPPRRRSGRAGLLDILEELARLWQTERDRVIEAGQSIVGALSQQNQRLEVGDRSVGDLLERGFLDLKRRYDDINGGFGESPKFPTPQHMLFLLRYHRLMEEPAALEMVEKTLQSMHAGGIYDHVGFGFSRYSTDPQWLVPHFEKMLYDNALLVMVYLETWQVTGKSFYRTVAEETLTYMMREMKSHQGGFYSAQDADSEGEEGKYYLWSLSEILSVLGEEQGKLFAQEYGITVSGNFENRNIPNRIGRSIPDPGRWDQAREQLYQKRMERVHPLKDDKILTGWNGLAIGAIAMAARILGNREYEQAARKAADFVLHNLVNQEGRLLARYREGQSRFPGYLEDYQYLIWGLLELYGTTLEEGWLAQAGDLMSDAFRLFGEPEDEGLYLYGNDAEPQLFRPREAYDGAMPSGNAIALGNLLQLRKLTDDPLWEKMFQSQVSFLRKALTQIPVSGTMTLAILSVEEMAPVEVRIDTVAPDQRQKLLQTIHRKFRPEITVLGVPDATWHDRLFGYKPELRGRKTKDHDAIYVCDSGGCRAPVRTSEELEKLLEER